MLCVHSVAEQELLREKIAQEATEELQRQALLEQQRCEEERLWQEELLEQQELAKGKYLI